MSVAQAVRSAHGAFVEGAKRPELAFESWSVSGHFSCLGLEGLAEANGLTLEENQRLADSQDLQDILELIVKGLLAVNARPRQPL